jgi:MFS family permease
MKKRLSQTFRALRHRNFRLFFIGQMVSLLGTWMQLMALSWLVYRLSHSAFILGVTGFVMNAPAVFLAPWVGIVADRFDRRCALILIQALCMLQAAVLAGLFFTHSIQIAHVIILSFVLGVLNVFELPLRQAFLSEMVEDPADLANAIALNSSLFNASRLMGPAAAGIIIAAFGEGVCFFINAVSFLGVIAALRRMKIPRRVLPHAGRISVINDFIDGWQYAYDFFPIRMILLFIAVVSMQTSFLQTLLPVFAKDIFSGGPKTLGFLVSSSGVGALLGAFYLAGRNTVRGLGFIMALSGMLAAVASVAFALAGHVLLAAGAAFFIGLGMILSIGSGNIILQTVVDEDKRGRVMSLYGLALMGMAPFGNILAGWSGHRYGVVPALIVAGVIYLLAVFLFWNRLPRFRRKIRPVYARKGIIPSGEV